MKIPRDLFLNLNATGRYSEGRPPTRYTDDLVRTATRRRDGPMKYVGWIFGEAYVQILYF